MANTSSDGTFAGNDLRAAVQIGMGHLQPADRPPATLLNDAGQVNDTAVAFSVFTRLMATDGLRMALYALLRRTDYRYIGIFRFQAGMATSVVHVDREDLLATQAAEVPETATYCCHVRDSGNAFVTVDSMRDSRTAGHAAREVVRSYCGMPILTPEGELLGTLCHYDLVPRDPEQLDVELLLQVSSHLAQHHLVPAYPFPAAAG